MAKKFGTTNAATVLHVIAPWFSTGRIVAGDS